MLRTILLGAVAAMLGACGTSSVNNIALSPERAGATEGVDVSTLTTASIAADPAADKLREAAVASASSNKVGAATYKVGPNDVLEVSVFKVPELSKTVQVSELGTINYPLIGETHVSGKTVREVERDLTKAFGSKYLQKPQVLVGVKEYNSQRVTVEGSVRKPGIYKLQGEMTLLQVVATAGGLTDASDKTLVIFRSIKGKRTAARFDLATIRSGASKDPKLAAGDVVIANASAARELLGNVLKALPLAGVFALL